MAAEYWCPTHAHVIDHLADDGGGDFFDLFLMKRPHIFILSHDAAVH